MKFFSTSALFALLLTSLSSATPTPAPSSSSACLTYAQASAIVESYRAVVMKTGNVTAEGEKLFAPSFTFTSDSFASLLGYPLGTTIGRTQYLAAEKAQPAITDIQTIGVGFECSAVLWQWKAYVGSKVHPIRGFTLSEHAGHGQLGPTFTEFNSVAFGEDMGGKYTPPSKTTT